MMTIMSQYGYLESGKEITSLIKRFRLVGDRDDARQLHINYSEFIAAILDKHIYLDKKKLWNMFQYFDTDSSGDITIGN